MIKNYSLLIAGLSKIINDKDLKKLILKLLFNSFNK